MNETDADCKEYDRVAAVGRSYISRRWRSLPDATRNHLESYGITPKSEQSIETGSIDTSDDRFAVEYTIGTLHEARSEQIPDEPGARIPSYLLGNEVLSQAAEVLHAPWLCREFAQLAFGAIIASERAVSIYDIYSSGSWFATNRDLDRRGVFLANLLVKLMLMAVFSISVGYGLTEMGRSNFLPVSVVIFFALGSGLALFGRLATRKDEHRDDKLRRIYGKWYALSRSYMGTGHGIEKKLSSMQADGITVPSILFDLCVFIQKDSERRWCVAQQGAAVDGG